MLVGDKVEMCVLTVKSYANGFVERLGVKKNTILSKTVNLCSTPHFQDMRVAQKVLDDMHF